MRSQFRPVIPDILYFHADGGGEHASVYLITGDTETVLVDPSIEPSRLPEGKEPTKLLLTHAHADHFWAVDRFREDVDLPLYVHSGDEAQLIDPMTNGTVFFGQDFTPKPASHIISDLELISVGDSLELLTIHTPGHTKGCCCFLLRETKDQTSLALITGDTLFRSSMGRTDLPSGSPLEMEHSLAKLRVLLTELPTDLPILPGHGPLTTPERELKYNPFL